MASMFNKLAKFASSPQGKQALAKAKDFAAKPENKAKIDQLGQKLRNRGKGGTGTTGTTPPR